MNRLFRLALIGLNIGLAAIVGAELTRALPKAAPLPEPREQMRELAFQPAPAIDLERSAASIRARPLFTPGRRPAAPPPPVMLAEAVVVHQLTARLAGLMIQPGRREALFATDGQKPIAVALGDRIEGWTVTSIEPDGVMLSGPSGERRLTPTGSEHSTSEPSTQAKPSSSGQAVFAAASAVQVATRLWLSGGSRAQAAAQVQAQAAGRVLPKAKTVAFGNGRAQNGL
jgi:hypothetical protein